MAKKKKRRKWPKIVALVIVSTLVVGSLSLVLVDKIMPDQTYIPKSIVQIPSNLLSAAFRPLQGAFAWVADGVTGYLESWKLRKTIEIEYNNLKAANDDLVYQALRNDELELENERLRKQLGVFDDYREMNPVLANVISKETSNWFQMFTIDRGSRHGVKETMAVVNSDGLVGYVNKVYATTSDVISIIDSRAAVAGIIQSTRDQGMIHGTLGIEDDPNCRMYYLPIDLVPRPGDTVVTSGIGMPFPKGIEIGKIRESTSYMDQNKHYVVVEPSVQFQHIEEVIVLLYEAPEEEMPEADDGQAVYVPVPLDTPWPSPSIGDAVNDPNLGAITPPPRTTRSGGEDVEPASTAMPTATADPNFTLAPGATPTANPELDALMQEEMAQEEFG